MSDSPASAASATYRKAVNGIATATNQKPNHSRYPSLDLEEALESIPEAMKQKAIQWYIRGIKRGMAKATDLMANQAIYFKEETVYCPKNINITVRTKFKGEDWERHELEIESSEIGFDK